MSRMKSQLALDIKASDQELLEAAKKMAARMAPLMRRYLVPPSYGTPMESIDGESGMAIGEGSVFCYNHRCTETHNFWKPAADTK